MTELTPIETEWYGQHAENLLLLLNVMNMKLEQQKIVLRLALEKVQEELIKNG